MSSDRNDTPPSHDGEPRPAGRILAFHKLSPRFSFGSTNFSPRRFDKLLGHLKNLGYQFVSVSEALAHPDSKRLAFTFDDGYAHLERYLEPLIEAYELKPTIFVPTLYVGQDNVWDYSRLFRKEPHLDTAGIKRLAALGVSFGSHGHSHLALTRLSPARLQQELEDSRKILEDITGGMITPISYPFGRYNRRVLESAAAAGYEQGLTMDFPTPYDPPLARGRYAVYGYDTFFTIRQKLSSGWLYEIERAKARFTNRLSRGTEWYHALLRRRQTG